MNKKNYVDVEPGIQLRFNNDYTKANIMVQADNKKYAITIPILKEATKLLVEKENYQLEG